MEFIEAFLTAGETLVAGFVGILAGVVNGITSVFYQAGDNGGLTIVGAAMAFALVSGMVYLIFRMVRGLIKSNNRG